MGKKSLKDQIISEINQREKKRLAKEAQEAALIKERCQILIWKTLDEAFAECAFSLSLSSFSEGFSYDITLHSFPDNFYNIAKELGFTATFHSSYIDYYTLSIPAFESRKGKERTPAQKYLLEFKRKLKQAKKERKTELLNQSKAVISSIEAGNYNYKIVMPPDDTPSPCINTVVHQITVVASTKIDNTFEISFIRNFFRKHKLELLSCSSKVWKFELL